MSGPPASSFGILIGWLNDILYSARLELHSAAIRHAKMEGKSKSNVLFWFSLDGGCSESGLFASMEHSGDTHVSHSVQSLVAFLKELPDATRQEIVKSLSQIQTTNAS